jgi:hypothetical protein
MQIVSKFRRTQKSSPLPRSRHKVSVEIFCPIPSATIEVEYSGIEYLVIFCQAITFFILITSFAPVDPEATITQPVNEVSR